MRSGLMELIMYGTMKQFDPVVNEIVSPPTIFPLLVSYSMTGGSCLFCAWSVELRVHSQVITE